MWKVSNNEHASINSSFIYLSLLWIFWKKKNLKALIWFSWHRLFLAHVGKPDLFMWFLKSFLEVRNLTQDGGFGPWAPWQPCNHDDGEGSVSSCACRSRSCDGPVARCGGVECKGPTIQVANCSRWNSLHRHSLSKTNHWNQPQQGDVLWPDVWKWGGIFINSENNYQSKINLTNLNFCYINVIIR